MPIARARAGSTANPNIGRQPQPAESNAKSSAYDSRMPHEMASCCSTTRPPRMRAGDISAM